MGVLKSPKEGAEKRERVTRHGLAPHPANISFHHTPTPNNTCPRGGDTREEKFLLLHSQERNRPRLSQVFVVILKEQPDDIGKNFTC